MSAGRYSFTIEQGATLDFELAYKDSSNNPIDLTGYQGRMQIRPSVGSDTVYITLSSSLEPSNRQCLQPAALRWIHVSRVTVPSQRERKSARVRQART